MTTPEYINYCIKLDDSIRKWNTNKIKESKQIESKKIEYNKEIKKRIHDFEFITIDEILKTK